MNRFLIISALSHIKKCTVVKLHFSVQKTADRLKSVSCFIKSTLSLLTNYIRYEPGRLFAAEITT